ncbi:CHAT domain-containing protein [Desulfococcaceae bacterium HSG9]|nr:CHAT domain-containing protein [Desulfococcaceae bacterium HSG9]
MKKNILILSANPKNTERLRADEEIHSIQEILQSAKHHVFKVDINLATSVSDLQSTLLCHTPHIVHFCGHGETDGLLLENDIGEKQWIPVNELANLFEICVRRCHKPIECVVLNACYSKAQAEAIHQHIPYVIGMSTSIGDKAGIRFAEGFYTGLGLGKDYSYPTAFKLGCNNIRLHNIPEGSIPVILEQQHTKPLQAETVDYEWDVFLSYEPVNVFKKWREEIFLHQFVGFLEQQLARDVKIFERKELCTGEDVPISVKNALARSRCFVGLCSPTYFNCYQCRYELSVMIRREQRCGHRTATPPLILIANVYDGEKFPTLVSRLMRSEWDFNGLTSLGIHRGRKSHLLEGKIRNLVKATEQAINAQPTWENTSFDDLTPDEELILDLNTSRSFPLPRHK